MKSKRLFLLLGATCVALAPGTASAQGWPGIGYGAWPGWWPAPRIYTQDYVPYFAKHPPVYYSRPIPRPYGALPYAYLAEAYVARPAPATAPLVVQNYYVAGDAVRRPAEGTSPDRRRIVNPFAQATVDPMPVPDAAPLSEPGA